MKSRILTLVIGLTLTILTALAQVVDIPDPELQVAIRLALDKPTGDITVADMEGLTELDASLGLRGSFAPPISSLEGLQDAAKLKRLDLSGECCAGFWEGEVVPNLRTTDLSSLTSLRCLERLDLSRNRLTTLSLPHGLTNLRQLALPMNELRTVSLPDGLERLTVLDLGCNRLSECSFLNELTSLEILDLGNNSFTKLSLPRGFTNLTTLMLQNNLLTTLTLPDGMTNLNTLDVTWNPIAHIAVPVRMNLNKLTIDGFSKDLITFHAGVVKIETGTLTWTQGILQFAPNAHGPWMDLPVSSPMPLSAVGERGFFRLKIEQ